MPPSLRRLGMGDDDQGLGPPGGLRTRSRSHQSVKPNNARRECHRHRRSRPAPTNTAGECASVISEVKLIRYLGIASDNEQIQFLIKGRCSAPPVELCLDRVRSELQSRIELAAIVAWRAPARLLEWVAEIVNTWKT
jgi:hypothetical protein